MPTTCASIEDMKAEILANGWRRIGIDGVDGSGKSFLALELSSALNCKSFDLDDYLHKKQGGYVDFIDYPGLMAALSMEHKFVLSGVCLRQVLARLGLGLDAHIYVKRMRHGLWSDEDECVFPDGVSSAIAKLHRDYALVASIAERSQTGAEEGSMHLTEEIMHYHDSYRPQEVADLVYERPDHAG